MLFDSTDLVHTLPYDQRSGRRLCPAHRAQFLHKMKPPARADTSTRDLMTRIPGIFGLLLLTNAACSSNSDTPTSPTPASNQAISYTAIGASDGIGFGGSAPCVPLDPTCLNGTGYVQILNRRLRDGGRTVSYLNLSLPGAVMSKAIEDLAAAIG